MSSLRKALLSRETKRLQSIAKDFTPVKWVKYFDEQKQVTVGGGIFNVYSKGASGPILVALHGGGYSALTWALFAEEIMAKIECQFIAIDLRGHGLTKTDSDADLALETLANDVNNILDALYENLLQPIVLIGHSMGGAIAVESATLIHNVIALCVIDVVEGSALESLSAMQSILRGRPSTFKSIDQAIQWSFRSGQTHNLEAARVSMPGQIKNIKTNELAAVECDEKTTVHERPANMRLINQRSADSIVEEEEESNETCSCQTDLSHNSETSHIDHQDFTKPLEPNSYTWRIDLSKTEPFWNGWFKGLSQKFLNVPTPKVLILANIHGLDTALTIGQMQGKFQLQVLPKSGHAIHEDQPHHVADIVSGFLVKQKLAVAKEGFTPLMPAC